MSRCNCASCQTRRDMEYAEPARRPYSPWKEGCAYARRIRNPKKRAYAMSYLESWLRHESTGPELPEGLSYMAAQAVRIELDMLGVSLEHKAVQP